AGSGHQGAVDGAGVLLGHAGRRCVLNDVAQLDLDDIGLATVRGEGGGRGLSGRRRTSVTIPTVSVTVRVIRLGLEGRESGAGALPLLQFIGNSDPVEGL